MSSMLVDLEAFLKLKFGTNCAKIWMGDLNAWTGNEQPYYGSEMDDRGVKTIILPRISPDENINREGRQLLKFCSDAQYILLNGSVAGDSPGSFTHFGQESASVIDYCMVNDIALLLNLNFSVLDQIGSDHLPIQLQLLEKMTQFQDGDSSGKTAQMSWSEDSAKVFRERIQDELDKENNINIVREDPNELISILSRAAKAAGVIRLSSKGQKKKRNAVWFDLECVQLKKKAQKKLRKARKGSNKENLVRFKEYAKAVKEFKDICRLKKRQWLDEVKEDLTKRRDTKLFWKTVKKISPRRVRISGKVGKDKWLEYLQQHFKSEERKSRLSTCLAEARSELMSPIVEEELELAIDRLRKGKAPGFDLLNNEMIKSTPQEFHSVILESFNSVLRGGRFPEDWSKIIFTPIYKLGSFSDPGNYRLISLLPVTTKLFTSILAKRLLRFAEEKGLLSNKQAAFRS